MKIEKMDDQFKVQINADLIRRLAGDENRKPRKVKPKSKLIKSSKLDHQSHSEKHSQGFAPWQTALPSYIPGSLASAVDKEIENIRKVLHESEKVIEKLHKEESKMAEEVKHNAKELHEKEFKMPEQKKIPCSAAKQSCLECYREHKNDPWRCAEVVKTFFDCACQAQKQYLAS